MIPKTKFGDCSNPNCGEKETACVKVGKELFCLRCRNKQKFDEMQVRSNKKQNQRFATQEGLSYLIDDLDAMFSKFIRLREADKQGIVKCYTCTYKAHWKQMQCGHFISRSHMATRYHEDNCRPQCRECNEFKSGNIEVYESELEKEKPGTVRELRLLSKDIVKFSLSELKEMLINYRHKVSLLTMNKS